MSFATFLLIIGLLVLVMLRNNQKVVEQYVPIRIDDEARKRRRGR